MSIRQRLVLLVLAVLVPAMAAALWVIIRTYQAEHAALERNARDTTRALALLVDREFTRHAAVARALAGVPSLDGDPGLDPASLAPLERATRRMVGGTSASVKVIGEQVIWLDTAGDEGATPTARREGARPLRTLPAIELVPSSGAAGARVAVIEPVRRDGRDIILNVVVLLPLRDLQRILESRILHDGWTGMLLDGAGRVVVKHPAAAGSHGLSTDEAARLHQRIGNLAEGMLDIDRGPGAAADAVSDPKLRAYFSKSPQGWTYITTVPCSQLEVTSSAELRRILAGAGVLLVVAVAGALWVARGIVRPVEVLENAARQLQAGRPVVLPSTGTWECDQVAQALRASSAALLDARGELERQVADAVERTRRAEQRAFLRERAELIGRLTGRVAHEFNNLLGVISNSAHLIARHAQDPKLQLPVGATLRAVETAGRLTQQLLRVGGRHACRPQVFDLEPWLRGMEQMLAVVLGKRIALRIHVPDSPLCVLIDPDELEFALISVVLNAREALGEVGEVTLSATPFAGELPEHLPAGPYVEIRIQDNGRGMTAEQAARVFEPFFSTKDADPATGFGLSHVQALCVRAGGGAWLDSQAGRGTTVSLLLPLTRASGSPGTAPVAPPPLTGERLDARVLLVEDNDALGDVTAALIESTGARVERAGHALEAIERLQRPPRVDVVLSDVTMPGPLDGVGLAAAVQARWPEIRVVLISAHGSAIAGAGGFPVLRKPCTPTALFAALRSATGPAGPRLARP